MGLTRLRAEQISDIDYKQAVRVITVTDIANLSGGAPSQVDGVSLSAGNRVLVTAQDPGSENGIYEVDVVGTGSNGTWIRSLDTNATGELQAGTIVMVTEGTVYADTQWKLTTNNPIIIGTTALTFEQNSAFAFGNIFANGTAVLANTVGDVLTLTAGNNIQITGNNTSKTVTIGVTGISLTSIANGTSNVNVVSSGGNVTVGIGGTANVATFTTAGLVANSVAATNNGAGTNFKVGDDTWLGDINVADTLSIRGQQNAANAYIVFGNASNAQLGRAGSGPLTYGGAFSATGNITGSNLSTAGLIVATGNITGGNITTTGLITATGNIQSGNIVTAGLITATGNIISGNVLTAGLISAAGTITSAANVTGGNIVTAGLITATGNITGNFFNGNGSALTGINAFSNVTVTGGNSAVADSISDTLTITAGSGIALVMDSSTDTLTIAVSSGSEIFVDGADFGTVTEPVTLSDDLGLVTEAVTQEADLGSLVTSGLIYPDQFVLPSYTVSTLPSAAIAGAMIYVTNESGGAVPAFSDGTNWRRVTDRAIVT